MEEQEQYETLPELVVEPITLWRTHTSLNKKGIRIAARGDVLELASLSDGAKKILERQGAISKVSGPPLSALPGWKTRGAKLAPLGIETVEQLLGVADEILAEHLNRKPSTITRWKLEAKDWLLAPAQSSG